MGPELLQKEEGLIIGIKSLGLKNGSHRFTEYLKGPQFKLGIGMTPVQIQT